ncbi:hypothetical protein R3P38DRAFT_3230726 [Favolaschia claudopus]|uniref:RING-type domain-containing protein n=1 Tax=Favolaschia claudopus TaxID=2862362 RepID=A0AAV9ZLI9_9AGAR
MPSDDSIIDLDSLPSDNDDIIILDSPPSDNDDIILLDSPPYSPQEAQRQAQLSSFRKRFALTAAPVQNNLSHARRAQEVLAYFKPSIYCVPAPQTREALFRRVKSEWGWKQDSLANQPCAICKDRGEEAVDIVLSCPCKHTLYHLDCLMQWSKYDKLKPTIEQDGITCPTCRSGSKPLNIKWTLPEKPLLDTQRQKHRARKARQRKEKPLKREKEHNRQQMRSAKKAAREMTKGMVAA